MMRARECVHVGGCLCACARVRVFSVPDFECLLSHYSCASFLVEVVMKPRCLTCTYTLLVYQCARTDGYMTYMYM